VDHPIRVLIDNRERHWSQNPFVQLWSDSLDSDIRLVPFTWRRALFGNYDIVHFNWPEYLFVYRNRIKHLVGSLLTLCLAVRIKVMRVPYVRSFHDIEPWVSMGVFDRFLIRILDSLVSRVVYLTDPKRLGVEYRAALSGKPVSMIKHPEYGPLVDSLEGQQPPVQNGPPFVLCFGILRPYKSYETVIDAFLKLDARSNVRLKIMGAAPDPDYLEALEQRINESPLIELHAGRVSDEVLVQEISAARCVVVPYERLYNSGVVFMALSAGAPVLLRSGPVASELQQEYGDELVRTYDNEITTSDIDAVLSAPRPTKVHTPVERTWSYAGQQYSDLYRRLLGEESAAPQDRSCSV
jgi:beta-1,4-mannosyltransferase